MEHFDKEHPPSLGTCPGLGECFFQAHRNFPDGGNILEFGVGGGYSFSWMAWQLQNNCTTSTLTGFDGWEGLPAETKDVWIPPCHKKGNYKHLKQYVYDKCTALGVDLHKHPQLFLVDGMYDQTLTVDYSKAWKSVDKPLILVNMDVDLHSSAVTVLNFILPLLQVGTMIYTDDWFFPQYDKRAPDCGVSLAFTEWLKQNSGLKLEQVWECPTSQRFFKVVEVPKVV